MILGGLFGVTTLLVHSIADFALHMPAVAIAGIMIAAHLARLGLEDHGASQAQVPSRVVRAGSFVVGLGLVVLAGLALVEGYRQMYAESTFGEIGIARLGAKVPLEADEKADLDRLTQMHASLERGLRLRPDSAEGHLRQGLISLRMFQLRIVDAFRDLEADPVRCAAMGTPDWWFDLMHPPARESAAGDFRALVAR